MRPNIYVPKPIRLRGFDPINKINITFERRRDMIEEEAYLFYMRLNYSLLIDETFLTLNLGPAL